MQRFDHGILSAGIERLCPISRKVSVDRASVVLAIDLVVVTVHPWFLPTDL